MTTTTGSVPRPVWVEEYRRAYRAVQAGDFRTPARTSPTLVPAPSSRVPLSWTPSAKERVLPVVGSRGTCGATTVALALATVVGSAARVVECAPASASGLAAASAAELGRIEEGWTRGSRGPVLLDRVQPGACTPEGLPSLGPPLPAPIEGPMVSVVDVAQSLEQLQAGDTWLTHLVDQTPGVVLVGSVSVPGLRRVETCLNLLGADRTILALVGPPRRRWPRTVSVSTGPLTSALLAAGRHHTIPEDKHVAVAGLTSAPLPGRILTAAKALLALTEGTPRHA